MNCRVRSLSCLVLSLLIPLLGTVSVSAGWSTSSRCSNTRLQDVWCASDTDAWCVGISDVFHWNGFSWEAVDCGVDQQLSGIWGFSSNDVYAVGGNHILYWDGQNWTDTTVSEDALSCVWGTGPDNVIVAGDRTIYQGSHSAGWTSYNVPDLADLSDIWGSANDDIYILGSNGRYTHFDGSAWTMTLLDYGYMLMGIWGFGPDDIHIVGYDQSTDSSLTLHWDGTSWTKLVNPSTASLYGVWGPAPDDVYAVGGFSYGAEILHYDGMAWSDVPEAELYFKLFGIHGASADSLFAVGDHIAYMQAGTQMMLNLDFMISQCMVSPGDTFSVSLNCENVVSAAATSCHAIIALEAAGQFFFFPSWSADFDSLAMVVPETSESIEVFAPFTWPDTGSGSLTGLRFWGAVMDDPMTALISNLAVVTWGYGP